jgi:hypothetical protein
VKIEEEELLRAELRKIEARKKEREKKTADLQKLIAQADSSAAEVSDLCFLSLCPFFLLTVSELRSGHLRWGGSGSRIGVSAPDPLFLVVKQINLRKIIVKNGYHRLSYPESS